MKEGDKKSVIKYAYFPMKINNKYIWFCKYLQTYEYLNIPIKIVITFEQVESGRSDYVPRTIFELQWIEKERKLL